MATYLDDFNRANDATTLGSSAQGWSWSSSTAAVYGIESNQAYRVSGGDSVRADADTAGADMYCQVRLTGTLTTSGPCVRFSPSLATYYHCRRDTTTVTFFRSVNNVFTNLGSLSGTVALGDTLRLEVTGSGATVTLEGKINGVSIGTIADTNAARIVTGTRGGLRSATTGNSRLFDDFEAGDLSGSPSIIPLVQHHRRLMGIG